MVVVAPPYERVAGSVIESTKEYEVQVSNRLKDWVKEEEEIRKQEINKRH